MELFQVDVDPLGEDGFTHPDTVDDRDGPLIDTLLALIEARFPPAGSPAATALQWAELPLGEPDRED